MRLLIAIALLFSITPGMTEVAESAVHLAMHLDLPHHDDVEEDRDCNEHSCTPLAHHCGCHTTMSAQTASRVVYPSEIAGVTKANLLAIRDRAGRACEPPPLRPPIG